ncbi:MAG TPA: Rpn family recombination-promoting nuclease/putative transposase [Chitinispirillaceae bacterium]|nr:Rpn family recombination-promoting nuclease/putative transposase [Chitinispirillaceae bacterium]
MKDRYINPFTDFGFKRLFGEEPNKEILIDFLNSLLKGKEQIKDLTYGNNEHLGRSHADRKAIFDLYCENDKGEKFIVEIQKTKQKFFKDRSIYYSTFPITKQAERGEWNFELKAVYTIAILDFTFDDEDRDKTVVSHVQLMETTKKIVFYDKLTFVYLQMPNFNKTEEELEERFDKWLYVFKNLDKLHGRPQRLQERVFEKLFSIAEIAKFTPEEVQEYEDSLMVYRDLKNSIDTAREEGREEGEVTGGERKALKTAEIMMRNGQSDEKMVLYTGLTMEQVQELRRRLGL